MASNTHTDWFARIVATLSLLLALGTGAFTYFQQESSRNEQRQQFEATQKENLIVRLDPNADGPLRLTSFDLGALGKVVQVPWELNLSNSSFQKLSVIQYELSSGQSPGSSLYSGIDGGLVTRSGERVELPLTLEPGDSKSFFIYVGILVPSNVFDLLSGINDSTARTTNRSMLVLAKAGTDIYGNHVTYTETTGVSMFVVDPSEQNSPTFWLRTVSGRGNSFLGSANFYKTKP